MAGGRSRAYEKIKMMQARIEQHRCPFCGGRGAKFRSVSIPEARGSVTFVRCPHKCGRYMLPFNTRTKIGKPSQGRIITPN